MYALPGITCNETFGVSFGSTFLRSSLRVVCVDSSVVVELLFQLYPWLVAGILDG
jgi:hypothetical protein